MTKGHPYGLEEAAKKISDSKTDAERLEALTYAYPLFAKETSRLEKIYQTLQDQFQKLKTELDRKNEELRQKVVELDITAYYLNSILLNMSQGLIFISLEGLVTTFNLAAEKMLGVSSLDVLFQSFWDAFDDKIFGFSMKDALKSHDAPEISEIFLPPNKEYPDGRRISIETNYLLKQSVKTESFHPSPLFDMAKGIIILLRDVTKIKQLEYQKNQNDRMKELGEMISLISHEIRNPLGGIKGYASLIAEEAAKDPELKHLADKLMQGIDHLHDVLNRIVNYSRPFELKTINSNLNSLIQEVVNQARMDANIQSNIQIKTNLPEKTIFAPIDPSLMRSCLLNLEINSIHAMPNGGTILFQLETVGNEAVIQVKDNGIGIPRENLSKIFQLFYTTKPKGKGTGFGLAEVSRVILAHDGTIEVDSEEGKGTTFTIKLPLNDKEKDA